MNRAKIRISLLALLVTFTVGGVAAPAGQAKKPSQTRPPVTGTANVADIDAGIKVAVDL